MAKIYALDQIVLGEESEYGVSATSFNSKAFGHIVGGKITITDEVQQLRSIRNAENNLKPHKNVDLNHLIDFELTFNPINLSFLKYVLGGEDDGVPKLTGATEDLPSLTAVGTYDETNKMKILGFKVETMTIKVSEKSIVEVNLKGKAKKEEKTTENFNYTEITEDPLLFLDGYVEYDGNIIDTRDVNIEIKNTLRVGRPITKMEEEDKRNIKYLKRTNISFKTNLTGEINDIAEEYEKYKERIDRNLNLYFKSDIEDKKLYLAMEGLRGATFGKDSKQADSDDVKTFETEFMGLSCSVNYVDEDSSGD